MCGGGKQARRRAREKRRRQQEEQQRLQLQEEQEEELRQQELEWQADQRNQRGQQQRPPPPPQQPQRQLQEVQEEAPAVEAATQLLLPPSQEPPSEIASGTGASGFPPSAMEFGKDSSKHSSDFHSDLWGVKSGVKEEEARKIKETAGGAKPKQSKPTIPKLPTPPSEEPGSSMMAIPPSSADNKQPKASKDARGGKGTTTRPIAQSLPPPTGSVAVWPSGSPNQSKQAPTDDPTSHVLAFPTGVKVGNVAPSDFRNARSNASQAPPPPPPVAQPKIPKQQQQRQAPPPKTPPPPPARPYVAPSDYAGGGGYSGAGSSMYDSRADQSNIIGGPSGYSSPFGSDAGHWNTNTSAFSRDGGSSTAGISGASSSTAESSLRPSGVVAPSTPDQEEGEKPTKDKGQGGRGPSKPGTSKKPQQQLPSKSLKQTPKKK